MGNDKTLKRNRSVSWNEQLELPINMMIEITNACNHECIFCAHSKMKRKVCMLDIDLYKDIAMQAYVGGVREIGFYMTGEPLMNQNVREYILWARKLGFEYIYMTTNGAMASIERMKTLIEAGLNSIKFSINAGTANTYRLVHGKDDFERVLKNLKELSEYIKIGNLNVGLYITCIRCRQNYNEVDKLREKVEPYVNEFLVADACNQGGNMYEARNSIMLDPDYIAEKAPCAMVFNRLHITCEGMLSACCVDFNEDLVVADLRKVSLIDGWNSEKMRLLRRMHLNNELPTDIMCYNCTHNTNYEIRAL